MNQNNGISWKGHEKAFLFCTWKESWVLFSFFPCLKAQRLWSLSSLVNTVQPSSTNKTPHRAFISVHIRSQCKQALSSLGCETGLSRRNCTSLHTERRTKKRRTNGFLPSSRSFVLAFPAEFEALFRPLLLSLPARQRTCEQTHTSAHSFSRTNEEKNLYRQLFEESPFFFACRFFCCLHLWGRNNRGVKDNRTVLF